MSCKVDEQGRILDAITYLPIPSDLIVRVISGQNIYCFNIDTIYRSMSKLQTKVAIDPFTRTPFPPEITARALDYGKRHAIIVSCDLLLFQVDYFAPIGDVIVTIIKDLHNADVLDITSTYDLLMNGIPSTLIEIESIDLDTEALRFTNDGRIEFIKTKRNTTAFYEKLLDYTDHRMSVHGDPAHFVNKLLRHHFGFFTEESEDSSSEEFVPLRGIQLFRDISDDDMMADIDEVSDNAMANIYYVFGLMPKTMESSHAENFWKIFDDHILTSKIMNGQIDGSSSAIQSIYRTVIALSMESPSYKSEYSHFLIVLLKKLIPRIVSTDYHEMMILRYHITPPTYRLIDELIQSHFLNDMLDPNNVLELNYNEFRGLEYPPQIQNIRVWKEGTINQSPGALTALRSILRSYINTNQYNDVKDLLLQRKDVKILVDHQIVKFPR